MCINVLILIIYLLKVSNYEQKRHVMDVECVYIAHDKKNKWSKMHRINQLKRRS